MKRLLLFVVLITHYLFAELPPYVYEELQKDAPESVYIMVKKVKRSGLPIPYTETNVEINAKIVSVSRSQTGLKEGDMITIVYSTYTSRPPGWVGPSSLLILKEAENYRAYLKRNNDTAFYIPAAKGKSFQ